MAKTRQSIILASGGTGGHIYPAEAVATQLKAKGFQSYLFTDERGRLFQLSDQDIIVKRIHASAMADRNLWARFKGLVKLGWGMLQAFFLLRRIKPAAVIGFGGYVAAPTIVAAYYLGIPVLLHEQNAIVGRANRFLAKYAKVLATSFPSVKGYAPRDFDKITMTGNPVRQAVLDVASTAYPDLNETSKISLFITSGSQGSRKFSEVIPHAIARLPIELQHRLVISQQCRRENIDAVRAAYEKLGIEADLQIFFTNMPEKLAAAHLVIGRAGASTIAELLAIGRPAIFVPYLYAIYDHQTINAEILKEAKAGWLMPQSEMVPENLGALLQRILSNPDEMKHYAANAKAIGQINAATKLADLTLVTIEERQR